MNDPNRNVRDWTEEDERKYREMLATPARLTEEEMLKLAAVSPYPPLGAGNVSRKMDENEETLTKNKKMIKETTTTPDSYRQEQETPLFGNEDKFAQAITEAGIKAAKATHEFNMREIKARLIADLCKELVKTPIYHTDVPKRAREIADKALENL